jgi:hypothetical protein
MLQKIKSILKQKNIILILLFFSTFTVYVHNLSPGVLGGDSGDLITAALTKGIPHPSGYPLYTMLGIVFSYLPIAASPAWKIGIISSLFSSLSVILSYLIVYELVKNRYLAILSSLSLAFSYTFWFYAEVVEVIALNSFFITLLTLFTVKFLKYKKDKYVYLVSFFSGLSLTNNLSIVLLFPAIFMALIYKNLKIFKNVKLILKSLLLFFLGLFPYLYIPIAASFDPLASWGEVKSWKNFTYVVLRKDYGWGKTLKYSADVVNYRLENYIRYWKIFINPLIPVLSLLGVTYILIKIKKNTNSFINIFVPFLIFGPILVTYPKNYHPGFLDISTIEKFYIPSIIFACLLIPYGVVAFDVALNKIIKNKNVYITLKKLFLSAFFLIPLTSLIANYPRTNIKNVYLGEDYAEDILFSLPKNSVNILVGDSAIFNSLYLQIAFNTRKDIYLPGRYEGFAGFHKARGLSEQEILSYQVKYAGGLLPTDLYLTLPNLVKNNTVYSDTKFVDFEVKDSELGELIFIPYGLVYKLEFERSFDLTKEEYINEVLRHTQNYHLESFLNPSTLVLDNFLVADIQKNYSAGFYEIAKFISTHYEDEQASLPFAIKSIMTEPVLSKL